MVPPFCCTLYSLAGLTAEHYESKAKHNESLAKAKQTLDADVEHLRKSKSVRFWGREHSWCTGKQQEQCLCHRAYAVSTRQKRRIILSRCSLTLEVAQYHYILGLESLLTWGSWRCKNLQIDIGITNSGTDCWLPRGCSVRQRQLWWQVFKGNLPIQLRKMCK